MRVADHDTPGATPSVRAAPARIRRADSSGSSGSSSTHSSPSAPDIRMIDPGIRQRKAQPVPDNQHFAAHPRNSVDSCRINSTRRGSLCVFCPTSTARGDGVTVRRSTKRPSDFETSLDVITRISPGSSVSSAAFRLRRSAGQDHHPAEHGESLAAPTRVKLGQEVARLIPDL